MCVKCSAKWFFYTAPNSTQRQCRQISDDCREWNTETGECTSCYKGYALANGACALDSSVPAAVTNNPHCKTWKDSECQECANRAFFDANRVCQLVNDQCWTWDPQDGLCLTCYKGYDLQNGGCVFSSSNTAPVADPGCKTWSEGICVECSSRWVFNNQNVCIPVADTCRTHDQNSLCLTCYPGYTLVDGTCLIVEDSLKENEAGCGKWNW